MSPRVFFVLLALLILAAYVAVGLSFTRRDGPTDADGRPDTPAWTQGLGARLVRHRPVQDSDIQALLGSCTDPKVLSLAAGQGCSYVLRALPWTSAVTRDLRLRSPQPFQVQLLYGDLKGNPEPAKVRDGRHDVTVDVSRDGAQVIVTCLLTACSIQQGGP
ncbi:hypothetical protein [Deinococcus humi]|uniref:Uncharacterized protein n=1 Tax=Deinococcus humi TaxID=662880 RepID=A0A7W8NG93_9DEIO|nr:hypothetical protein [Deinococcus humi]MBB5363538.1 hypothetical protein [Deinococcus humi]GGO30328.1 hypothetical protein GCM10008949_25050 [Deinococcus humi]